MQDYFLQCLKSLINKYFDIFDTPSSAVNIRGYSILRKERDSRGGGFAFYVKTNLNVKIIQSILLLVNWNTYLFKLKYPNAFL